MFLLPGNAVNRAAPLNRGLLGWWMVLPNRLGGGGNTFRDLMGRNHGTLTNGPTWSSLRPPGGFGSLKFTASSSHYVSCGSSASHALAGNDFHVGFWVNPNSVSSYQLGIARDDGINRDFGLGYGFTTGKIIYFRGLGSFPVIESTNAVVVTGAWNFIEAIRTGSTVRLYRNGVLAGSGTDSNTTSITANLTIGGRDQGGGTQYVDGYISEAFIKLNQGVSRYFQSISGYQNELNWQRYPVYGTEQAAATFNPAWAINSNAYIHLGA